MHTTEPPPTPVRLLTWRFIATLVMGVIVIRVVPFLPWTDWLGVSRPWALVISLVLDLLIGALTPMFLFGPDYLHLWQRRKWRKKQ